MRILCNPCCISYRRARARSGSAEVDLDMLARRSGPHRLSISKEARRLRRGKLGDEHIPKYMGKREVAGRSETLMEKANARAKWLSTVLCENTGS